MTGTPVRLGLIGAGPWGGNYIGAIEGLDGVVLSRLADSDPERRAAAPPGCAASGDWREVAGAGDLDGVVVATPPARHGEMARLAIESGLAVLIEKPLTTDLAEARALLALAEARRGRVMVAHIHLFSPAWQALKEDAADRGPVRAIESEAGRWGPFRPEVPVIWDWGSHDVAMCLDLIGCAPSEVDAQRLETRDTPDGHGEVVEVSLAFGTGAGALITLGNILPEKKRIFAATFDSAVLTYDDSRPEKFFRRVFPEIVPEPVPVPGEPPLDRLVRAFAEGIASRRLGIDGLRLGVEVVEVLSRCAEALGR